MKKNFWDKDKGLKVVEGDKRVIILICVIGSLLTDA